MDSCEWDLGKGWKATNPAEDVAEAESGDTNARTEGEGSWCIG